MADIVDIRFEDEKGLLTQIQDLISAAVKTGTCSDLRVLEISACQLATLDVDKALQLKLMLDAGRFF